MSQRKSTLLGGVAILSIAGIITKVIGMFFRVPLMNMIGSSGMGIYQAVYPTYTLLLTISTAGIPVAISRLVSENVARGKNRQARAVLRTALLLMAAVGAVLTLLMLAGSGFLANAFVRNEEAGIGFMALAPSILLVSIMSAFRGYMQGRSHMTPTAVSQVIEQLAKVAISLPLASLGMQRGYVYAGAGALLGITIGEGLALLYMAVVYLRRRGSFLALETPREEAPASFRALSGQMVRIAIPITIGAMIVPLSGFIDSAMITRRLMAAGFDHETAVSLFGILSGAAVSLANVPTVLATSVCISLVPLISAARVDGRGDDLRETSQLGMRLGSLIGLPCTAGMALLATPIIYLLYPGLPADEIIIAGRILTLSALTIFSFTQVQATTGILQGAGHQKIPMYSLVAGVACKILLNYFLIAMPSVNVYGAPMASIVCYTVSMGINMGFIARRMDMRMDWGGIFIRPGAATLGMGAAVLLLSQVMDFTRRSHTLLAVAVGVLVYCVLILLFGALRREDLELIPGGKKMERLLLRLKVWR